MVHITMVALLTNSIPYPNGAIGRRTSLKKRVLKVRVLLGIPDYAPLVKWMITLCYERRGGGSIPSWGTKVYGR